ncbi:sugar ABC transporter permease [Paenibacillus hemerocallicola]|uniref:Sugar ABC transporter permease n=1 Tax=Paenibacillus hemerocallicola TaxID=1172614 RepID=A0A5C4T8S6_9BACL|nr:sugar ABC transporter permease [Paenibacillus hemerocallicola]TNJ64960.1 sugar ABC transporter permease [Paenibacillus hemerocallicola]
MKPNSAMRTAQRMSFILPAMMLLVLLTGYPLANVVYMSFFNYANPAEPSFFGLSNYIAVLKDPLFWKALGNTLVFTFGTVVLVMLLGLSFASLLNLKINPKVRGAFRSVLMFPWLLSSSVVGSIWMLLLAPFGLLNWFLLQVGVIQESIAWLSDGRFAMPGLILANAWRSFPFAMLMLLAAFQTVPEDIKEAAQVDGAGRFTRFTRIVLPHIKGIMLTILILEIIWNFRSFDLVFLMTGGGPMHATEVLSTYVYNKAFRSLDFGYSSALAIFMLIVMVLISLFYIRSTLKKEGD